MKSLGLPVLVTFCLVLSACGKNEEPAEVKVEVAAEKVTSPKQKGILPDEGKGRRMVLRPDCALLDQPEALRTIFYPRRDLQPADELDVFFPVADGIRLGGRLHIAKKDSPVILLFHGNGEIASDYDRDSILYKEMGVSLLVVDYRGYGKSNGRPTASALLDDATAVYRQVRHVLAERGLDGSRLFIMGRSLGSAAAIEAASHAGDEIEGLIIESGFASALPFIKNKRGSLPDDLKGGADGFANAKKISRLDIPTLIIHGQADLLLPVGHGKKLYESCGGEQKRLVIIPNAGHNNLLHRGRDLYFSALREFIFGQPT